MANGRKIVAKNKKATHDYFIEEVYEAGIVLTGTEIKSIRNGRVNLKESFAKIIGGEVFVFGMHISPYEQGNIFNVEPLRQRKLLLNKREIMKLNDYVQLESLTLIPLSIYLNSDGRAKVELAVCRGKKLHDKRRDIAKKDSEKKIRAQYGRQMKKNYD